MFAVLIVQGITQVLQERQASQSTSFTPDPDLISRFGSVAKAMLTLLKSTTGGMEWGIAYQHLEDIGWMVAAAFLFYVLFFVVAAFNIVTSMFVDKSLKLAQPDIETLALEQNMKDIRDSEELTKLF